MNNPRRFELFGPDLDAVAMSHDSLFHEVSERLRLKRAVYIRRFATEPTGFITFLSRLGRVLPNYGQNSGSGLHSLHPGINRARISSDQSDNKYVHGSRGELVAHSARSWRKNRPRYFGMLMVDPGWHDKPYGQDGESICVRWQDAPNYMRLTYRDGFVEGLEILSSTPLHFAANNVIQETSTRPLLYELPGSSGPLDFGARMKSDIMAKISIWKATIPRYGRILRGS